MWKPTCVTLAADPIVQYMTKPDLKKSIENTKKEMLAAAKDMDFLLAAKLRDEMFALGKDDGRTVLMCGCANYRCANLSMHKYIIPL